MSRVPLPELPGRIPDAQSERRLTALRREAAQAGMVSGKGVSPEERRFHTPRRLPDTTECRCSKNRSGIRKCRYIFLLAARLELQR